jgi:ubiquinone/menaquinone biosynthesis C-methylase UbiE
MYVQLICWAPLRIGCPTAPVLTADEFASPLPVPTLLLEHEPRDMSGNIGRYTYGHVEAVLRSHKWRTLENSARYMTEYLKPQSHVLDIGCGPGSITAELAQRCANVFGVDAAEGVVKVARNTYPLSSHPNLQFLTGNASALPFPDSSFDVVHAHQTIHHVNDQVAVLSEMRRVCVPGGLVAIRDADYATSVWEPHSDALSSFAAQLADLVSFNGGDPRAAVKLSDYAVAAGFAVKDIKCSSSEWRFDTASEREWWGELWVDRVLNGPKAEQMRALGTSDEEIDAIVDALKTWSQNPEARFVSKFGEIVCHKSD